MGVPVALHGQSRSQAQSLSNQSHANEYCVFSLDADDPTRQHSVVRENPLCKLAALTPLGTTVCNRGCGLAHVKAGEEHICPFGMVMQRVRVKEAGRTVWIGRRFVDAFALHRALDRLMEAGHREETLLANLPDDPVVAQAELQEAAKDYAAMHGGVNEMDAAKRDEAPAQPKAEPLPEPDPVFESFNREAKKPAASEPVAEPAAHPPASRVDYLLEYMMQVHHLLLSADHPERICDRFLRALGGCLPCDEMAIYLRSIQQDGQIGEELVLAATLDNHTCRPLRPQAQHCRLEPGHLGSEALYLEKVMVERDGEATILDGDFDGRGRIAVPLIWGKDKLGVLVGKSESSPTHRPLVSEPMRLLRLVAEIMSARLHQVMGLGQGAVGPESAEEPRHPGIACWAGAELEREVQAEVARAQRKAECTGMLRILLESPQERVTLPIEELSEAIRHVLRPYDRFARYDEKGLGWIALLPDVEDTAAHAVAMRIEAVVEDVLDARGGMEELGIRLGIGGAVLGGDATTGVELIEHAEQAMSRALQSSSDVICFFDAATEVVGG